MPEDTNAPFCYFSLITRSTDEPLFEWDIVSDRLFMAYPIQKSLNLSSAPETMSDFYKLMPPDGAGELAALRANILLGKEDYSPEYAYLCNGSWVREHLMVLARNSEGRATRVVGRMAVKPVGPEQAGLGFNADEQGIRSGVWIYDVKNGKVWRDKNCARLLGKSDSIAYPIAVEESLADVHPAERDALRRHYRILCEGTFFGDSITDLVRLKMEDGTYAQVYLRGSVVERNEAGKAVLVAGMLHLGEKQIAAGSPFRDDNLFHALSSMGGGQWNWDTASNVVSFCPRYLAVLGYKPEDSREFALNWRKHIHPDDYEKIAQTQEAILDSPDNGDTFERTYRMLAASGEWVWIFDRGCVTWRDKSGRAGHIIGSITNITTAQAERDRLEDLVRHDTLTGLRSRAFCNLEIEHIEQNGIRPVCVISVDVTGLKMVNDNLGHSMGDAILTKAASILRGCLRKTDCVARVGGDEFLVLLPNCTLEKGKKLVDIIKYRFVEYNSLVTVMPVFVAVGLACGKSRQERLSEIMNRADEAMYEDKKLQRKQAHQILARWVFEQTGKEPARDERLPDGLAPDSPPADNPPPEGCQGE